MEVIKSYGDRWQTRYDEEVPSLIIGGSLSGLSASLFLSWYGTNSLLVERHYTTSIHPRANIYNLRTMELFRSLGLQDAIDAASSSAKSTGILKAETLVGNKFHWLCPPYLQIQESEVSQISPVTRFTSCAQDLLEPILRKRAEEMGGDLRYGTELISFDQDINGITALIRDRRTGDENNVRARYMIAADGANSPIRLSINIPMKGPGALLNLISILFHADLSSLLRGRQFGFCHIENSKIRGGMASYGNDRYTLNIPYNPQVGERPEDFTRARCLELVSAAVGQTKIPIEIDGILPWELGARVAHRFQEGNIFLLGDAAHVIPPTGAFGANTAIQDAQNLAWKIALVLRGVAGPCLLSTYDSERHVIGEFTVKQAALRCANRIKSAHNFILTNNTEAYSQADTILDDLTIILGYCYNSRAVYSESNANQLFVDPRYPEGQVGGRAPHVVLELNSVRLSTLDLLGKYFVLFTGANGQSWYEAAKNISRTLGIRIDAYQIDEHRLGNYLTDVYGRWHKAFGVTSYGAVLIRPDGFVCWKACRGSESSEDTEEILHRVLSSILAVKEGPNP